MSWCVEITGNPDPKEIVSSMCHCEGNLALATERVGFKKLPHIDNPKEAQEAILKVIEEIDKENSGVFNDDWCEAADLSWSGGKEMAESWRGWDELIRRGHKMSFTDEKTCWGMTKRTNLRESAIRFYLYYKSGYEVNFKW